MNSVQALIDDDIHIIQNGQINTRRNRIIFTFIVLGISTPFVCWFIVLCGVDPNSFYSDTVATSGILLTMYAPCLAFLYPSNRSLKDKLYHFAVIWYYCNTLYQLTWELPWFVLKQKIFDAELLNINGEPIDLTGTNKWFWPWWAYGKTDTRYLYHNDMTIAITCWDGIWAISEVLVLYLFWYQKYGIFTAWYGLIIGICQEYGQFIWYFPVIYNNFSDLRGNLGNKILKFGIMSIPWVIYMPLTIIGFSWYLIEHYKKLGVKEYLDNNQRFSSKMHEDDGNNRNSFAGFIFESGIFLEIDNKTNKHLNHNFGRDKLSKWIMWFIFVFPWCYFIVDVMIWYSNNYW